MVYLLHFQTGLMLLALIFIFNLWVSRTNTKYNKSKLMKPPEPPGRWPIIGHLLVLRGSGPLYKKIGAMANKFGPVFTLQLGSRRFLIVSSWEVAKECFTTNDIALGGRAITAASRYLCYNGAYIAFASYGPYWREVRKIAILELLSNIRLETIKHSQAAEIGECIKELYGFGKGTTGGPIKVGMTQWFGDLTFNAIARAVVGKRYLSTTGAFDDSEGRRMSQATSRFFQLVAAFVVSDVFPFLKWMDMFGPARAMKGLAKELDSIAAMWIEEHRGRPKFDDTAEGESCFIDAMLSIMDNTTIPDFDAETAIKSTCLSLILGGTHTTTKFLIGNLTYLLRNPHVLKKAREELDIQVGKARNVEESDLKNLVYLQAIVKETMRVCSAGSLALPHVATQDCTVGGFHVTAGTEVMLNVFMVHQDPIMWPDPSEFRPERFLTSHVDVDVRGQHFELIPFGAGRRVCPGISFALQMMQLTLGRLIHGFDMDAAGDKRSLEASFEGLSVTNPQINPLEVLFMPRLPSNLYE